jgi:GDSL-like lipase/acylhydrolase family protein
MTRIRSFTLLLVAFVAAPLLAARGKADFTTLVTLGDSFGVGVSSVGANITHQRFSWPAVLARQVGLRTDCIGFDAPNCFQIPYISEPGIAPELQLVSLSPLTIMLKPGLGAPLNSGLQRPYNNLSIDGAEIADALQVDGDGNEAFSAPIVLRGLGSMTDQALRLNPTFIALWLGGDDAFNGVQGGKPSLMTPLADFTRDYNAVLDKLTKGAPNAGFVVGNLPTDIRGIPFVSLIPPFLLNPATNQPVLDPSGKPIPLIADLGGGNFGPLPPGSLVLLTSLSLIQSGFGIPAALKPLLPPLPNIGKPLPDEAVLTPTEIAAINQRLIDYNAAISAAAAARDIPVVDINSFFAQTKQGIEAGPIALRLNYIIGGIISLDGFHLTDMGYTLFADQYIKTINAAYGTSIPLAPISQFLQNNLPANQLTFGMPRFDDEAARAMHMLTPPVPRRHSIH